MLDCFEAVDIRAYCYEIPAVSIVTVYSNFIIKDKELETMTERWLSPSSVSDLRMCRERSRTDINAFLEDREVDHKLGSVPGWKAAFGARYRNKLIAVCVLGRPVARQIDAESVVSITRFATRPCRPANTGSWLIARARDWARLEGYEKVIAYAGVAGNYGTIYEAAGFELVRVDQARGDGWTNRDGRTEFCDYKRRKWKYEFTR